MWVDSLREAVPWPSPWTCIIHSYTQLEWCCSRSVALWMRCGCRRVMGGSRSGVQGARGCAAQTQQRQRRKSHDRRASWRPCCSSSAWAWTGCCGVCFLPCHRQLAADHLQQILKWGWMRSLFACHPARCCRLPTCTATGVLVGTVGAGHPLIQPGHGVTQLASYNRWTAQDTHGSKWQHRQHTAVGARRGRTLATSMR